MAQRKAWKQDRRAIWRKAHPWVRFVEFARRRCNDTDCERWRIYREKGITCDLTSKQLEVIWQRDSAHLLKRPSLDRYPDCDGNYTLSNVRFIEFNENPRIARDRRWDAHRAEQSDGTAPDAEFA